MFGSDLIIDVIVSILVLDILCSYVSNCVYGLMFSSDLMIDVFVSFLVLSVLCSQVSNCV